MGVNQLYQHTHAHFRAQSTTIQYPRFTNLQHHLFVLTFTCISRCPVCSRHTNTFARLPWCSDACNTSARLRVSPSVSGPQKNLLQRSKCKRRRILTDVQEGKKHRDQPGICVYIKYIYIYIYHCTNTQYICIVKITYCKYYIIYMYTCM